MAANEPSGDDSLYPIAVLIDELRNEDVQVKRKDEFILCHLKYMYFYFPIAPLLNLELMLLPRKKCLPPPPGYPVTRSGTSGLNMNVC